MVWFVHVHRTVADPGFPRRGVDPTGGGANLLFGIIFGKNCIKIKKQLHFTHTSRSITAECVLLKTLAIQLDSRTLAQLSE